jgi:hypothetical protein
MSGDDRSAPYRRHRFAVDIGERPPLGFTAVRGLAVRVEVGEEAAGADGTNRTNQSDDPWWDFGDWFDQYRDALPSAERRRTRSPDLELSRGVTDDDRLWDWLQDWVAGTTKPRDVHVVLLDEAGDPARGWRCRAAVPVEWTGPELVADRSGVATETLELAHEGIEPIADVQELFDRLWGESDGDGRRRG